MRTSLGLVALALVVGAMVAAAAAQRGDLGGLLAGLVLYVPAWLRIPRSSRARPP